MKQSNEQQEISITIVNDDNCYRLLLNLGRIIKELYNSCIVYVSSYYDEHGECPSLINVLQTVTIHNHFQLLDKRLAIDFLATIAQVIDDQLNEEFENITTISNRFILPGQEYSFYIPSSIIHIDNTKDQIYIDIGSGLEDLYSTSCIIPIHHKYNIMQLTNIEYIIVDISKNNIHDITFRNGDKPYKKYCQLSENIINTKNTSVTEKDIKKLNKTDNLKWLSIDLGNQNFANIIDTVTFNPFILDLQYIFVTYDKYLNTIRDIGKKEINKSIRDGLLYNAEKKMKRSIKFSINKIFNYILNYCEEHKITTIVCGKTGYNLTDDSYYKLTNSNLPAILQGLIRYLLRMEAEVGHLTFIEVDENITSQYCSSCGSIDKKARSKKNNLYTCKQCGCIINGDINASINILAGYIHEFYQGPDKQKQLDIIQKNTCNRSFDKIERIRVIKKQ